MAMTRWRGALVTGAVLAPTIVLMISLAPRPTTAPAQPSASSPIAAAGRNLLRSSEGFDLEIPEGWLGRVDNLQTNRSVRRLVLLGNRGLEAPSQIPSTWPSVPTDRVIVELVEYIGGPPPIQPKTATEFGFPLEWQKAQELRPDGTFAVRSLIFSHVGRRLGFTVHIGPDAPAPDVARIAPLVASLRPEPIPTSGFYRSWRVIGPLDSFAVGSVTHFDAVAPNVYGFYLARGQNTIFAHTDRAFVFNGGFMNCPAAYDSSTKTFLCARSGDRWSRVGKLLTAPTPTGSDPFGLAYQEVLIKDGLLLVGGGMSGGRISEDEVVEFGDRAALPTRTVPFTRAEIVARLATITSVDPLERTVAKLVASDSLGTTLFPGLSLGSGPVWVVAFAGPVHTPQSQTSGSMGNWALFVADPVAGGVIAAMCCAGDTWPAAFDSLPDSGR
jgi:hypothetical protein